MLSLFCCFIWISVDVCAELLLTIIFSSLFFNKFFLLETADLSVMEG